MEEEKKEEGVQVEEKEKEIVPVEVIPEEKGPDVLPTFVEKVETPQVENKEQVEEKVLEPEVVKEVENENKNETVVLEECEEVDIEEDDIDGDDVDIDEEVHEDDDASSLSSAVPEEREDGDGEEEKEETKKLDDDEDKRNPQYIPKKGMFYEHDDRTADVDEEEASAANDKKTKKGKVWEDVDLWRHDLYDDNEQGPKSTQELIDTYGYDIRREEGPPKARRRRRYGKGPNKYQRSWEDEGAYIKSSPGFRGRRPNRNFVKKDEDFPELPSKEAENEKPTEVKVHKKVQISNKVTEFKDSTPVTNLEKKQVKESPGEKQYAHRGGRGGSARGRGGRGKFRPGTGRAMNSNVQPKPRRNDEEDIAALAQHFSEAVINIDKNVIARSTNNEMPPEKGSKTASQPSHKNDVSKSKQAQLHPPQHSQVQQLPQNQVQLQQQQNQQQESRSKRYSAQRQRSLPQSNPHPQQQPQQQPPQPQQQQQPQQTTQQSVVQQQFMPQQPQQQIPPPTYYPQQQHGGCVDAPAPGGMPQNYPGMQVVAFLPPPPHPPPAQPGFPPPPLYVSPQYLPSPTMAVQPGPTEVYQGGGITFYNTQTQMARPTQLSRRVKLAIPIISPNESQAES